MMKCKNNTGWLSIPPSLYYCKCTYTKLYTSMQLNARVAMCMLIHITSSQTWKGRNRRTWNWIKTRFSIQCTIFRHLLIYITSFTQWLLYIFKKYQLRSFLTRKIYVGTQILLYIVQIRSAQRFWYCWYDYTVNERIIFGMKWMK